MLFFKIAMERNRGGLELVLVYYIREGLEMLLIILHKFRVREIEDQ